MDVLRRSWQFRHVYQNGKKISCTSAVVFYLENEYELSRNRRTSALIRNRNDADRRHFEYSIDSLRIGVVASKRVGNAVKRNRAKRLLREVSRELIDRLNQRKMWMVFIARPAILDTNYRDIVSDVENGLARAGLLAREQ